MKKRVISVFSALIMSILVSTSVLAGGAVQLSGVRFSLGSLIADGIVKGMGNMDVTVELVASGIPDITCRNNGGNYVPGQSTPKITASGHDSLPGNDPLRKNGRSPFGVETQDPEYLPWNIAGCPNANWTAHVDFISWTHATITVYDSNSHAALLQQNYSCITTRYPMSVTCTPIP